MIADDDAAGTNFLPCLLALMRLAFYCEQILSSDVFCDIFFLSAIAIATNFCS